MRTKILLIAAMVLVLLPVAGCRTNKANEKQSAEESQPAASPSVPSAAASPQDAAADSKTAQSSATPRAKLKTRAEATPASPASSPAMQSHMAPTATPIPTYTPTPPLPVVIPAGTALTIRTTAPINSSQAQANQDIAASLAKPLLQGETVIAPVGAPVKGVIVQSKSAGRVKGEGSLILSLTSLTIRGKSYKIVTTPVAESAKSRGKRSTAMIGGGGAAGALIGGLAGGGKGAAIGALAGAGAGTVGATVRGKRDIVIPAETILNFKLSERLVLPPAEGAQSTPENPQKRP